MLRAFIRKYHILKTIYTYVYMFLALTLRFSVSLEGDKKDTYHVIIHTWVGHYPYPKIPNLFKKYLNFKFTGVRFNCSHHNILIEASYDATEEEIQCVINSANNNSKKVSFHSLKNMLSESDHTDLRVIILTQGMKTHSQYETYNRFHCLLIVNSERYILSLNLFELLRLPKLLYNTLYNKKSYKLRETFNLLLN